MEYQNLTLTVTNNVIIFCNITSYNEANIKQKKQNLRGRGDTAFQNKGQRMSIGILNRLFRKLQALKTINFSCILSHWP